MPLCWECSWILASSPSSAIPLGHIFCTLKQLKGKASLVPWNSAWFTFSVNVIVFHSKGIERELRLSRSAFMKGQTICFPSPDKTSCWINKHLQIACFLQCFEEEIPATLGYLEGTDTPHPASSVPCLYGNKEQQVLRKAPIPEAAPLPSLLHPNVHALHWWSAFPAALWTPWELALGLTYSSVSTQYFPRLDPHNHLFKVHVSSHPSHPAPSSLSPLSEACSPPLCPMSS